MRKVLMIALLSFLVIGCGEPKIDGSTKQSFIKSMGQIGDALPEPKRAEFLEAIDVLAFNRIESIPEDKDLGIELENINAGIREILDGKTASQIIAEAEPIKEGILSKVRNRTGPASE